ncbi:MULTISPECIES: response regulator [Marinobacter]|uniref:Response regulator n=1 Tax=Marinobacter alkaliphilus TaxID=254719 RepID=A0ABZ3E348_9GAMM|nr:MULTISPECIES: response regulator [unclassified Marinobacter]AMQ89055.1 two-component system response regulator [Marinobacter sp. LQ44]MDX5329378.1 response regulator [Marinobacter sp.]QFS85313.1 Transcriptional regulatory protein BasR [Marinobacter sp. THAF197a]QFT49107.1 Transcriptional regulatory protein BasR [Marinobacter sp. THAF39]|tara:strand:- start:204 stop:617 length:414 start_codon:yes stop_codon:yes gene_type:complete
MTDLRILVVEDEPVMRERLAEMLYKAGATQVAECPDAASARAAFDASEYHIVLLDLGLPDGDGHELMTRFKQIREDQHIVLVTADDSIESIQRAISAGANGYVVKPYSQEKIHDVVNNYAIVHGGDMAMMQGLNRRH